MFEFIKDELSRLNHRQDLYTVLCKRNSYRVSSFSIKHLIQFLIVLICFILIEYIQNGKFIE